MKVERRDITIKNLSLGEAARLTRLSLHKRQLDIAAESGTSIQEVIRFEKNSFVLPSRQQKILSVLGLKRDGEED